MEMGDNDERLRAPGRPAAHNVPIVVPVKRFTEMTPRTRLLTLDADATAFSFHAGQAVWLRRRGHPEGKPYSIASAPADLVESGILDFLVGIEDEGPGPHLADLTPGSLVEMDGPLGGFDLPQSVASAPVLLVAGGTGIAPLRSMWRELLAHPDASSVSLVYSARRALELAFLPELRELERRGRIALSVTITGTDLEWSGGRGRLTSETIARHLVSAADTRCAVCGPGAFVAHVIDILVRLGVPARHIATERW
jgi:NAD(P)H-flavin reductase